jgi:hypothetical protein
VNTTHNGVIPHPRARGGVLLEALALCLAVAVAVALTRDPRAARLHMASVWAAAGLATIPLILSLVGAHRAVLADAIASMTTLGAIIGSYTIGGLALLMPAFLLLAAGVLHYLAIPERGAALGLADGRPQLIGAAILGPLGAFLGLSLSPVAFVGWALSVAALALIGTGLSRRRLRRGKTSFVAWLCAGVMVLGLNVLPWFALSLVHIF